MHLLHLRRWHHNWSYLCRTSSCLRHTPCKHFYLLHWYMTLSHTLSLLLHLRHNTNPQGKLYTPLRMCWHNNLHLILVC